MKKQLIIVAMAIVVVAAGCGKGAQPKEDTPATMDTSALRREVEAFMTEDSLRPLLGGRAMPSRYEGILIGEDGKDTVRVGGMVGKGMK